MAKGRPVTITGRPTPAEARELQRTGRYQADRHKPIVDWSEVAGRPKRRRLKGGKKWIRNAADERAFAEGCWFDERQAAYVTEWFPKHLVHCEGEWSGQPFDLLEWQRKEIMYPLFGWQRIDDRGRIVRRHRWTFIEVPKKNGKSTLASGIGLYMLVGEERTGAEVYSYAADRDQASIVHGYAIRLVEVSDLLSWFLDVNRTTKHIYNIKHGLRYRAESSRPATSQGRKGNCAIVDELHAWYGQELWDSVRKIGYAWSEQLLFCITTAGDDDEHICFHLEEYSKAVLAGTLYDRELLACIYQAQPDEDIRDPEVQKRVNPSLGTILSQEELNDEIKRSEAIPREMMSTKRYRFNIWASRTASWLDMAAWDACRSEISDEALEGMPCVGGLDLALKHDMSALALIFMDHDCYHLRVWAWLPEARVKALQGFVSLQEWSDAGWLKVTGENVVDFKVVEDDVCELFERFTPRQWAYDVKYAPDLARRIEERTKTEPVEFGQSMVNFAGPTLKLEQMVNAHTIRHNNNGLLNWQISNVRVKSDYDQNIRPVRPDRNDHKTIDTVVAAVMALGLVTAEDEVHDYYDDHVLEMG